MPDLSFGVMDAEMLPYAASPTMLFKVQIANAVEEEHIHSIMLRAQVRLEVTRRHYDSDTEGRLLELFGEPRRWGETLRSLLWTHVSAIVPRFTGTTVAEVPLTCTYDFDVAAAKYLYALEDGYAPMIFLFSGTVFYTDVEGRVQIAQIPWEKEADFRLPVHVYKEMMEHYFPNTAWLRIRKDVFDRLYAYKSRGTFPTWEEAIETLLPAREAEVEH
ncbi:MAG: DUF6084 family protein [Chloroflexota bacterium]|nr:MAG: hypothetical protein DLM70_15485 [Chloroflexota bacterium]